jgi:hypothetical protein
MPLVNSLTGSAGFKLGPVLFETLVRHYFEGLGSSQTDEYVKLRKDEILYDEAFNVVKVRLPHYLYFCILSKLSIDIP